MSQMFKIKNAGAPESGNIDCAIDRSTVWKFA